MLEQRIPGSEVRKRDRSMKDTVFHKQHTCQTMDIKFAWKIWFPRFG